MAGETAFQISRSPDWLFGPSARLFDWRDRRYDIARSVSRTFPAKPHEWVMWEKLRIGLGHDTHRLGPAGPLRLGGVSIPHNRHAIGHSDADVLLHAITDALLGAAGAGDIGQRFPDSDPANRGRDSRELLRLAWHPLVEQGWRLQQLDCVVFAQRPKLLPYWPAIRLEVAATLSHPLAVVRPEQIGVKAKTGEAVGHIGREEAIAAQCVALVWSH
jgi:2-C-methyl-D-erythritol 2,4-cyclodiphosphate synthase